MRFKLFNKTWDLIFFWVLVNPLHWLRNRSTGKSINNFISDNIDNPVFEYIDEYTIKLNGEVIWIKNYPYEFGCFYNKSRLLPSRVNVFRLKQAVDKFLDENGY